LDKLSYYVIKICTHTHFENIPAQLHLLGYAEYTKGY